jgi:hypothetical protein
VNGEREHDDAASIGTGPLELVSGQPYHWHDWCIARGRDCLYIWSDAAALELSNGSNGWFLARVGDSSKL